MRTLPPGRARRSLMAAHHSRRLPGCTALIKSSPLSTQLNPRSARRHDTPAPKSKPDAQFNTTWPMHIVPFHYSSPVVKQLRAWEISALRPRRHYLSPMAFFRKTRSPTDVTHCVFCSHSRGFHWLCAPPCVPLARSPGPVKRHAVASPSPTARDPTMTFRS